MLQSISSPRREAASPPSPRCTTIKKRCYKSCLDVTPCALQFKTVSQDCLLPYILKGAAVVSGSVGFRGFGVSLVGLGRGWTRMRRRWVLSAEVLGQAFRGVGCRSKSEVAGVGPARWCCISLKTVFKKLDFCPKSSNRTEARQRAWIGQVQWMHSRLVGRCSSSWAC
jgi:hypothetical protein